MNKEKLAATKSGAIGGIPTAALVFARLLSVAWKIRGLLIASNPALGERIQFVTAVGIMLGAGISLGLMAGLGAVGGLVFVLTVNKLPFRSTYVKAAIPFVVLWLLGFLAVFWSSSDSFFELESRRTLFFVVSLLGAVVFSYLFDRWKK